MQASPALPWDWQHGGTVTLKQAITREQLLAGVLQITLDDDTTATIEENDGTLYIAGGTPSADWWEVQITSPTLLTIVPNLPEEDDGPTIESIQRRELQVTPALPWSIGQGGTIRLAPALTMQDLINGVLSFEVDYNGVGVETEVVTDGDDLHIAEVENGDILFTIAGFEGALATMEAVSENANAQMTNIEFT